MCFIFIFSLIVSATNAFACDKPEAEVIREIEAHTQTLVGKIYIYSVMDMMREDVRTAIREYYRLGRQCISLPVYQTLSKELLSIGFPAKYLTSILGNDQNKIKFQNYQIGPTWDREIIKRSQIESLGPQAQIAKALVLLGKKRVNAEDEKILSLENSGSGFYLGKLAGQHIVGTALHVLTGGRKDMTIKDCGAYVFHFTPVRGGVYKGKDLIISIPEIDFAICSVDFDEQQISLIDKLSFDFDRPLVEGDQLVTAGYGTHTMTNLGHASMDRSPDCQVILDQQHMAVKDDVKVLGMSCDVSSGDSGSAVVLKQTNRIVGFSRATTVFKAPLTIPLLHEKVGTEFEDSLWPEVAHLVPATEIKKQLLRRLDDGSLNSQSLRVLTELLEDNK